MIRTSYPRFRRPMLYPDELQAQMVNRELKNSAIKKERLKTVLLGVPDGARTHDNQIHNLALYRWTTGTVCRSDF